MDKQSKIYVAGHRGLVGSAIVRNLQAAGYSQPGAAHPCRAGADGRAGHPGLLHGREARLRVSCRRQGGRHRGQQHLPGQLHPRQPGGADECDPFGLPVGGPAADVPGLELHLPQAGATAAEGDRPADRRPGAHQPGLCPGQDRRHRDVLELQPPVRHTLPVGHAHQPVWARATTTTRRTAT